MFCPKLEDNMSVEFTDNSAAILDARVRAGKSQAVIGIYTAERAAPYR